MTESIEQLKELPVPPAEFLPCDIKYVSLYLWDGDQQHWTTCNHKTLENAEAEAEWAVPGTLRIFEVPPKERN